MSYHRINNVVNLTLEEAGASTAVITGKNNDTLFNIQNITGSRVNDILTGNSQDNIINGEQGYDIIFASRGNDIYNGDDTVGTQENRVDYSTLNGIVNFISVTLDYDNLVTVTLDGIVENHQITHFVDITATNGNDIINADNRSNDLRGGAGNDILNGGSGTLDRLYGEAGNDTLDGQNGNDQVYGGSGNDLIFASLGDDVLQGDSGTDTLRYDNVSALGHSVDISFTGSVGTSVLSNGDASTLRTFEFFYLTNQSDSFEGSNGVDQVFALNGNDTFFGSLGNDVLDGGSGSDTADYSTISGQITIDLLNSGTTRTQVNGANTDFLTNIENIAGGGSDDTLTGNNIANVISGNAGDDVINGEQGNDTLNGDGGDDVIVGGTGNDIINGGSHDLIGDYVDFSHLGTSVVVNLSTNSAVSSDGSDTITNIENVYGSSAGDTITGDGNANVLEGNGGNDNLSGGNGDDTLIGGSGNDTLNGGSGFDTIDYSDATSVNVNLQAGTASGGDGSDTLSSIENVIGTNNGDTITGSSASNTIDGGNGFDIFSFTNSSSSINLDLDSGVATGFGTDNLSGIENYQLSNLNDTIDINVGSIDSFNGQSIEVNGRSGTDHVDFNNSGGTLTSQGIDGNDISDLFSNVEELDFRNTDLTGGDTFQIGDNNIAGIAQNNGDLTIFVNLATIALSDIEVLQQGSLITGDSISGGGTTRTIDWADGTQLTVQG